MTLSDIVLALGLMAVIEGLVFALAPLRFEELLKAMSQFSDGQRRTLGLLVVASGVFLVWVAKSI